jgi:membrane protease YdiL (CAAX protease family)
VNASRPTSASVVFAAAAVEGGLAIVALAAGWLVGVHPLEHAAWTLQGLVWGLAAAVPLVIALVTVTWWPIGPLADLEDFVKRNLVPLFRSTTVGELALICALAGLGEEMLFRGVAQAAVERWTGSPWLGLAAASALFGLAHPITRTYAVVAAVIGVYFGWLFTSSGNLVVPIVAHAAYDFVALLYLARAEEAEVPPLPADTYGDEWSI